MQYIYLSIYHMYIMCMYVWLYIDVYDTFTSEYGFEYRSNMYVDIVNLNCAFLIFVQHTKTHVIRPHLCTSTPLPLFPQCTYYDFTHLKIPDTIL